MRISVYEEIRANYLTHTKDLNLSCELHVTYKGEEVMSLKQRNLVMYT
jgi:hypothetical protein